VIVSKGEKFEVNEEDLLDSDQSFVKDTFQTGDKVQKQKEAHNAKRRRCLAGTRRAQKRALD
jgi:hypothetical protein